MSIPTASSALAMDSSLSHLPESKQAELRLLTTLIRDNCRDTEMVILYGSYARGDWKEEPDLPPPEVRKSGHPSDYDVLVVTARAEVAESVDLWNLIGGKARTLVDQGRLTAKPRIIAYDIESLNERLKDGRYFYSDIRKEGRMLYDSGTFELAEAKDLSPEERYVMAKEYYDHWYERAEGFFKVYSFCIGEQDLALAAFNLHQAAETALKTILLVFTSYNPNDHWLAELIRQASAFDESLPDIFPHETDEDNRRFKLLDYAYIGARYDPKYSISDKDLGILAPCVRTLLNRTKVLCEGELERIKA